MKHVLITGSSGFLGRHLNRILVSRNIETIAIDSSVADLTHSNSLTDLIRNSKEIDTIFHLAAYTRAGTFCDKNRGEQWIVNQQINTNVLKWWQAMAPQAKLIALGTSASYAPNENLVESNYMTGEPYDGFYAYAMCKRMLLVGLQSIQKQYGCNYLYAVPSTLYGKDYHLDSRQPHFIYDLIRKILRGKLLGERVMLWGDGEQRRELIHVENFIEILLLINSHALNDIYNIGGGIDFSIKEFAKMICELVGYDFNLIQFDTSQYVGAKSKILNIEKYQSLLAHNNKVIGSTCISDGLQEVIQWYQHNNSRFLS